MTEQSKDGDGQQRIRIWDLPTRIFHWVLLVLFVVCFMSGTQGRFDVHVPAGQALLTLVIARIIWGLVGSETSRLGSLLHSPRIIAGYVRGLARRSPHRWIGHNPLGSLSVLTMLAALLVQTGLGLFAADVDGLHEGPLSILVDYSTARQASSLHAITADILLVLVALHLAAILFYILYKRDNILSPMITGYARFSERVTPPRLSSKGRAVLVLAAAAAVVLGGIEVALLAF